MNRLQALYPARIWYEDDVYYVQFLDLENGFTFGENLTQAILNAGTNFQAKVSQCETFA
jgi:predicted RNase H-like HicB family nuclease